MEDGARPACRRAAELDRALAYLIDTTFGRDGEVAVIATGGYGRGELSPHSDVDVLLLVRPKSDIAKAAVRGLLYPLWDGGWQVGHSVLTGGEAINRARGDFDAATSLLTARPIGGREELWFELVDRRSVWLRRESRRLVRRIVESVSRRHQGAARAGWALAPNIRDDAGGLRDIHAVRWLGTLCESRVTDSILSEGNDHLLAVREALHSHVSRKDDRLHIDLQPAIARSLGLSGTGAADELMTRVHTTARAIEVASGALMEELSQKALGGPRRSGSLRSHGRGVSSTDGRLVLSPGDFADSVHAALALAAAHSASGRTIAPRWVAFMRDGFAQEEPVAWDEALLSTFFEILRGSHVVSALEVLDRCGGWPVLIPEWQAIRGRAQHDPYHRYTVDGHLFLTVAEIQAAADNDPIAARAHEEADFDVLRMAALLHDIGKGSGEDHSIAGKRIASAVCERMGMSSDAIDHIATLVQHHLVLADTATRRDIDDGAVVGEVAAMVRDPHRLRLLYVLTIADARATGPEAWTPWKAALVRELYRKVLIALETGEIPARSDAVARAREIEAFEPTLAGRVEEVLETLPRSYLNSAPVGDLADEVRLLLRPPDSGGITYRLDDSAGDGLALLTLCVSNRPGALARAAGVFALRGIPVLRAQAYSTSTHLALQRFVLQPPAWVSWEAVISDLKTCFSGRLALEPEMDRKVRDYASGTSIESDIRVLQEASSHSTIVEVRARDAVGVMYAIASAVTDLDLDIHMAKIDTLGRRIVDVLYVRTAWGTKLDDEQTTQLTRSIRHRMARLYS
jgi:[protein-PII] uridylyltransferase